MNLSLSSAPIKKSFFTLIFTATIYSISIAPALVADNAVAVDTTDLSQMDWSDEPAEKETDLSQMDWSDEPTVGSDLSKESWADDPGQGEEQNGALSEVSWEDAEGENSGMEDDDSFMRISEEEEKALAGKERRIHIYGFILFIGYILGGILTAYFTRNRKVAVDYPPELLIILHTLWPVEWLFLIFAGKKVR